LASPGYALGTIAVNVTWKEREFNACQTHRSKYPSIYLQPFPSNSTRIPKFAILAHFGLPSPWVRPWDNRGKCYIDRKRIQCWSNASQHIPIYLQPFLKYSDTYRWRVIDFQQSREVNERF